MTAIPGQLNIDGREVKGSKLDLPGLGKVEYDKPIGWDPVRGDHIRITVEYSVIDVRYPWKHNSEGVPVGNILELVDCRVVVPDEVEIVGIVTKAQIDQAWDAAHSPQQAAG